MILNDTCDGCLYAHPAITDEEDDIVMKCRRFPPTVFVFEEDVHQMFPDANTRCGEYKSDTEVKNEHEIGS